MENPYNTREKPKALNHNTEEKEKKKKKKKGKAKVMKEKKSLEPSIRWSEFEL